MCRCLAKVKSLGGFLDRAVLGCRHFRIGAIVDGVDQSHGRLLAKRIMGSKRDQHGCQVGETT